MAITVKQLLRRRGALVASMTALSLGGLIAIQQVLSELVSWISISQYASAGGGLYELEAAPRFEQLLIGLATTALPFVVGFFLSLWLVAPIAEELGLGHVIARSVLATGIGATLWFVVLGTVRIIQAVAFDGPLFGQAFPVPSYSGPDIPAILGMALQGGLTAFIYLMPLGVLAGILLWHWRAAHPPEFHVSGLIDV